MEDNNQKPEDVDELSELRELQDLLDKKKLIEENIEENKEQSTEDLNNNLNIFTTWMKKNYADKYLYKSFVDNFHAEYRSQLFENVYDFFKNESFVTDEILFYWKLIIICLIKNHKKFKLCLDDLVLDMDSKETNLRLVKDKHIFKCFIDKEQICFFKENSNDYYVS
ncbi:MAG: hypothetical protein Satyrvirus4_10 [Satyrvirus sp.]|uniref:Uncharacterized protein n=1 Tax=Satyrvirus sp. TaxID=2487771 RepID=A0A3G5AGW5_9VIRU|nr:MAG: hypothetical protein Satyrvirus4_10 [Satyrvirus sp.]